MKEKTIEKNKLRVCDPRTCLFFTRAYASCGWVSDGVARVLHNMAGSLAMARLGFYTTWLGLWPWRELMCQRNNDTRTDWGCNHTVFTTYKALDRSNIGAYLLATTKICKVILKNFSSIFCYIMSTLIHDLTALS